MSHETHDETHESHGGLGLYIGVFVALCALTTLSFLTYADFWRESVPTNISRAFMMAVSCTKAMLVIMFFMHLKWEANWKWVLTAPVIVMSALLIFALVPDVGLRMRHASQDRMIYAAEQPAETKHTHGGDGHEHNEDDDHDDQEHEQEAEEKRPAA